MSKSFTSILKKTLRIILPLALGVSILWWVYRTTNMSEIMTVWHSGVHFEIIFISLFFGLSGNIIRACRWKLLIRSLGENPKTSNLVYAVLGNYALNYVLPRLGEVWRCGIISKYEKISFSKLLGTLLIDRLADTIAVGVIVLFCFGINIPFFEAYMKDNPELLTGIQHILTSWWLYLGIIIAGLTIWLTIRHFRESKLIKKTLELLKNVWEGIKTVWHMKDKWMFLFYTVLIWLSYFLFFYICFYAFDFTKDLGWKDGLTAFGLSSVAVAIPVPGAMGTWHAAVSACLLGFGVEAVNAKSFAFIVYLIQNLFTALAGVVGVTALPIANKNKKADTTNL